MIYGWLVGIVAALFGALTAFARMYKFGPFLETPVQEPLPPETTEVPPVAVEPVRTQFPAPSELLWSTPHDAFHSTRVICDEMGLTYDQKNEICYTIYNESEFKIRAMGKPNKDGTRDYGICQFNTGKNAKGIPFWIGEGATFSSIEEVLTNPEKCVRTMIRTYKAGQISLWYGHKGYSQLAAKSSPMWKL